MLILIFCVFIGTQLILSALTKFRDFSAFFYILKSYPLPQILKIKIFARVIIFVEFLLGVSLISLNERIVGYGLWGVIFFIFLANILIILRRFKGEKKFRCGCGLSLDEEQNVNWLLGRNFCLIILAFWGLSTPIFIIPFFSKEVLFILLIGWGSLSMANLLEAGFNAIFYIRSWKASG